MSHADPEAKGDRVGPPTKPDSPEANGRTCLRCRRPSASRPIAGALAMRTTIPGAADSRSPALYPQSAADRAAQRVARVTIVHEFLARRRLEPIPPRTAQDRRNSGASVRARSRRRTDARRRQWKAGASNPRPEARRPRRQRPSWPHPRARAAANRGLQRARPRSRAEIGLRLRPPAEAANRGDAQ